MRTRQRPSAQVRIVDQSAHFNELADRPEAAIFQLTYIEMASRCLVLRPAQKDVARCLHDMLSFDDPPTRVALEFRAQAFQDGFSGFLDLQKQRGAAAAREQPDRTERPDAANANRLEGEVLHCVSLHQTQPFRWKACLI